MYNKIVGIYYCDYLRKREALEYIIDHKFTTNNISLNIVLAGKIDLIKIMKRWIKGNEKLVTNLSLKNPMNLVDIH